MPARLDDGPRGFIGGPLSSTARGERGEREIFRVTFKRESHVQARERERERERESHVQARERESRSRERERGLHVRTGEKGHVRTWL